MTDLLASIQDPQLTLVAAFGAVVAAGLLMGVAPSSLPLVSVVVGTIAGRAGEGCSSGRRSLLFASGFVLGIATVDAAIGGLFGLLGDAVILALAGSLVLTS